MYKNIKNWHIKSYQVINYEKPSCLAKREKIYKNLIKLKAKICYKWLIFVNQNLA